MRCAHWVRGALSLALVWVIQGGADLRAKTARDQWYFTGSIGYLATRDSIASNADEPTDPRPANFVGRESDVHDGGMLAFHVGFGLTRLFALQVDAGYFRGAAGPVDVYMTDTYPASSDALNPTNLNTLKSREQVIPVSAGELTQIPVSLSGILRFRTDKTFNPYLGAGVGRIYSSLGHQDDVADLNARLGRLRIRSMRDEHGVNITPNLPGPIKAEARIPWVYPVTVEIDDAWETHVMGGLEWSASSRISIVAEARYTFTSQMLRIDLDGQDQVNARIYSEKLFRKDGSVQLFNQGGVPPNPFKNSNPLLGHVSCQLATTGDFDSDGHAGDLCYPFLIDPAGTFLVQGGEINMSQTTITVGLRVYF